MTSTNFKPMLASKVDFAKLVFPLVAQPKLDGIRCSIVNGHALTRTLKQVPNREIFDTLSKPEFEGLDGEIIVGDPTAEDAYRRTVSFAMSADKTGEPWAFHVFDKWNEPTHFWARYGEAADIVASITWTDLPVFMVPSFDVEDMATLEQYEAIHVEAGHEGVIVRNPRLPYKFGRASANKGELGKVKRFIDFEAEILSVYEELHNGNESTTNALGRTERSSHQENKTGKNRLGGLTVRAINGPAEGIEFNVGTGFDAATRVSLWQDSNFGSGGPLDTLQGVIVKVKSFPIGVKDKPRHPVFLGFRDTEMDG